MGGEEEEERTPPSPMYRRVRGRRSERDREKNEKEGEKRDLFLHADFSCLPTGRRSPASPRPLPPPPPPPPH